MISSLRKEKIRELLYEKKSVTVNGLSKVFNVTTETIRTDLKALSAEDASIKRSYGGAYISNGVENLIDVNIRMDVCVEAKERIAQYSKALVVSGDTLFLDNSTTCFYIAKEIQDMHLTVLTNNLPIINLLSNCSNIKLVSIGGIYSTSEMSFYGNIAVQTMENYFVDKVFFSSRFVSLPDGITDSSERWTLIRKKALKHATKAYYVADHSKFDHTSYNRLAGFDEIDQVITDTPLRQEWHDELKKVNCLLVDE